MKRRWLPWEEKFLRDHYAKYSAAVLAVVLKRGQSAVYGKAKKMGLEKPPEWMAQTARERSMSPEHGSKLHKFKPGHKPWSTGTKGVAGVHPNSRRTQFKPRAPHEARNYIQIGGHRVNSDGYVCRKVRDDGPPQNRFVPVHRLVWIEAHGEIPFGHVVVFRRGMRTTDPAAITVDRLELLTNAQNLERNRLPPELQRIAQLRGALTRAINKRIEEQSA